MASTTAPSTSNYSAAAIVAALAGIVAIVVGLAAASMNVKESTARELAYRVVAGNISVVGTARVRLWQGDQFTVQVPAGWKLIADGLPAGCTKESSDCAAVHRWQGLTTGTVIGAGSQTNCTAQGICVELWSYPARATERTGNAEDVRGVWERSFATQRQNADVQPRYLDYGGVTAKGGRWVARAQSRVGANLQTSYLFATCLPGSLGRKAQADRYWELRLTAPADAIPTFQFYDLIASLQPEAPSPRRGQDCTFAVKG